MAWSELWNLSGLPPVRVGIKRWIWRGFNSNTSDMHKTWSSHCFILLCFQMVYLAPGLTQNVIVDGGLQVTQLDSANNLGLLVASMPDGTFATLSPEKLAIAFERHEKTVRQQSGVDSDDFIFGRDSIPVDSLTSPDTFFFFDQSLGAFRGGAVNQVGIWSASSLGKFSFAYGQDANAPGSHSAALGNGAQAMSHDSYAIGEDALSRGGHSIAIGRAATADGWRALSIGANSRAWYEDATALGNRCRADNRAAIAVGIDTRAYGDMSMAIGNGAWAEAPVSVSIGIGTRAKGVFSLALGAVNTSWSAFETVLGFNNTPYTPNDSAGWHPEDRLLVVGNGELIGSPSDALVLLKNGDLGLGTSTPVHPLEMESGAHSLMPVSGRTPQIFPRNMQSRI